MQTQELQEKLQNTYHKMVDNIETLIEKDGHSLKEAVELAEEKISDLGELTKEEVSKVTLSVKEDLQSFGEVLNGAKEAYKKQFKLDATYLTDSVWNKLQKIANVTTEEFAEFNKDLKDRVQKIRMDDHLSEHQEHTLWHSEHALWSDEIKIWKKDHQQALEKLKAIEDSIQKHSDLLEEHAQVILSHEKLDQEHEEVMVETEIDPSSQVFESDDKKEVHIHHQENEEHAKHAALHQSIKKHHRKMMALVNSLYKQTVEDE